MWREEGDTLIEHTELGDGAKEKGDLGDGEGPGDLRS